jgi:hypothetical protein
VDNLDFLDQQTSNVLLPSDRGCGCQNDRSNDEFF